MKNSNILMLVFLLISSSIFAQKPMSIIGKVIDLENSKSLQSASIILVGNGNVYQTISDKNGKFYFKNLQKGTYNIYTNVENYLTNEKVGIVLSTQTVELSIGLEKKNRVIKPSYSYIPNVRYFYVPYPNPIVKAPNQNINAIAAYVRGVDSRNCETPSIKGSRPENTAYYIDGVRIVGMDGNYNIIGK